MERVIREQPGAGDSDDCSSQIEAIRNKGGVSPDVHSDLGRLDIDLPKTPKSAAEETKQRSLEHQTHMGD